MHKKKKEQFDLPIEKPLKSLVINKQFNLSISFKKLDFDYIIATAQNQHIISSFAQKVGIGIDYLTITCKPK
jgi:hypothetical protein